MQDFTQRRIALAEAFKHDEITMKRIEIKMHRIYHQVVKLAR